MNINVNNNVWGCPPLIRFSSNAENRNNMVPTDYTQGRKKQINLLHDFLKLLGTHFCMKIKLKIAPVTYIVSSGSNCNWASMKIFWFGMLNMPVFYFVYSLFIIVLFTKTILGFYYLKESNASLWIIYHLKN